MTTRIREILWLFAGAVLVVTGFVAIYPPHAFFAFGDSIVQILKLTPIINEGSLYTPAVILGFLFIIPGTLILAYRLRNTCPGDIHFVAESETPINSHFTPSSRWKNGVLTVGLTLVGCSGLLMMQLNPGTGSVAVWCLGLIIIGLYFLKQDKDRGTMISLPFSGKSEWFIVVALFLGTFALVGWDLIHWRWMGTPDETMFFVLAKKIAEHGPGSHFILSENGVFGYHPVLSTLYQVFFMKLFGADILGWKLSSAVALAVSVPFLYLFVRELLNRRAGIFAAVLLATSSLALSFGHFGYNNIQVYPILTVSLGLGLYSMKRRNLLGQYLAGVAAGLGFYTYYTGRWIPVLLVFLALTGGYFPIIRRGRVAAVALGLGIMLTIMPLLLHADTMLVNMVQQTSVATARDMGDGEILQALQEIHITTDNALRLAGHWFMSLTFGVWFKDPHHFQRNPIMDPVSATAMLVGLWLVMLFCRRSHSSRFLTVSTVLSALVVGSTSPYSRPPLTRLMFMMPILVIPAALAMESAIRLLKKTVPHHPLIPGTIGALLIMIPVVLNPAGLWQDMAYRHHGFGDGTTSELVRMSEKLEGEYPIVYIQNARSFMVCVDTVMDAYGMGDRFYYLRSFEIRAWQFLNQVEPPFTVFISQTEFPGETELRPVLKKRFPEGQWQNSAPGKPWNLKVLMITELD